MAATSFSDVMMVIRIAVFCIIISIDLTIFVLLLWSILRDRNRDEVETKQHTQLAMKMNYIKTENNTITCTTSEKSTF